MKKTMLVGAIFGLLVSCGSSDDLGYEPNEFDSLAIELCSDKGWEAERTESGLHIYVSEEGSGEKAKETDFVDLALKGYIIDGTQFADTKGQKIVLKVADIQEKAIKEGIQFFGKGGKGVIISPPDLAYGAQGVGPIPPNSTIYFDVEVLGISDSPPPPPVRKDYSPEIEAYAAEKGWDAKPTGSGLYVVTENAGGDEKPAVSQQVTIFYKGYLMDGTVFDGTGETPATFGLGQLIPGWQEGIPYFGKGGKGKLIIPPYLGYGERGSPPKIPGNAIIVFDIEVVDFSGPVVEQ